MSPTAGLIVAGPLGARATRCRVRSLVAPPIRTGAPDARRRHGRTDPLSLPARDVVEGPNDHSWSLVPTLRAERERDRDLAAGAPITRYVGNRPTALLRSCTLRAKDGRDFIAARSQPRKPIAILTYSCIMMRIDDHQGPRETGGQFGRKEWPISSSWARA